MGLQRISEHYDLAEAAFEKAGVFNAVVGVDSLFFVDPLRLKSITTPEFVGALDKVRAYYGRVIELLRMANPRATVAAAKLVQIKELRGVGIGYGDTTEDGSAVGPELAKAIIESAQQLIQMGVTDPAIFEVMGLFEKDFGPDRLSDSLIGILFEEILSYTQRMSSELGIPTDYKIEKNETTYVLPTHPSGGKPLVLIPQELLRSLPVATSYADIAAAAQFNDDLRARFNRLLAPCFVKGEPPSKEQIKEYVLATRRRASTLVEAYKNGEPIAYDFENDPEGLSLWLEKAREVVKEKPIELPVDPTDEEVVTVVEKILSAFRSFIETKGGWRGLYNDKMKPLNERHARLFFYAIALEYKDKSNIDISPESNAGQGPVDFKASRGSEQKVVVEVKLSKGGVEHGYTKQVRIYQASEDAQAAYFVVLQVSKRSPALTAVEEMEKVEIQEGRKHPHLWVVNALHKDSASKPQPKSKRKAR